MGSYHMYHSKMWHNIIVASLRAEILNAQVICTALSGIYFRFRLQWTWGIEIIILSMLSHSKMGHTIFVAHIEAKI